MIVKEYFMTRKDGIKLYRTYSDANKIIYKIVTDEEYVDAIDVETAEYVYEETDKEIPEELNMEQITLKVEEIANYINQKIKF